MDCNNEIKGEVYKVFTEYLIKRCDMCSFIIPDYTLIDGEPCPQEDYAYYKDYIERSKQLIKPLESKIILNGRAEKYFDQECNYFNNYYVLKLDSSSIVHDFLLKQNNIFDWICPNYPEDICFYSNRKRFFQTVAHEEMCFIRPENAEDLKMINYLKLNNYIDNSEGDFYLNI